MHKEAISQRASNSHVMKLGIIISYLFIFFVLLPSFLVYQGFLVDRIYNLAKLDSNFITIGMAFFIVGIFYMVLSMFSLSYEGSGLPISHLPPKVLVRKGMYRVSRHPIYVGFNLAFIGLGLYLRSIGISFVSGIFLFICWVLYASKFEEPILLLRFGEAYRNYIESTPLLPLGVEKIAVWIANVITQPLIKIAQKFANKTILFSYKKTIWVNWGSFLAVGSIFGLIVSMNLLSTADLAIEAIYIYYIGMTVTMLFFGRLFWLLYQGREFFSNFWNLNRRVGFVSYGGYFGVFVFTMFYSAYYSIDVLWLLDRTWIPMLLVSGFGRFGCLTYGCCYGKESSSGITYTDQYAKIIRVQGLSKLTKIYPTQIYSSVIAFLIFGISIWITKFDLPTGAVTIFILYSYSITRFLIEYLRDQKTYTSSNITSGQIGSLIIYFISFILMIIVSIKPQTSQGHLTIATTFMIPNHLYSMIPIFFITPFLTFLVCGLHIRKVGRW